jgi:hypothetical protein
MDGYRHEDAFDEGYIQVSDLHRIYYAQYGNRNGKAGELTAVRQFSEIPSMG